MIGEEREQSYRACMAWYERGHEPQEVCPCGHLAAVHSFDICARCEGFLPDEQSSAVLLSIGRNESYCGACGKSAWPTDIAHTTPTGYDQHPGCGAVFTHVVATYYGMDSESRVKEMRPDLTYGAPK